MSWTEIAGQDPQCRFLEQVLKGGRLHHAYLFHGPEGIGKKLTAINLAKAINCASGNGDACGSCISCLKADRLNHPDIILVEAGAEAVRQGHPFVPEEPGEKPSQQIKIKQVRQIEANVRFAPLEGRRKVFIIDDAHRMNLEAANAFLKTLEEPPAYATFILVSHHPDLLLPTILSRCQAVRFKAIGIKEVAGLLKQKGIGADEAETLASLSEGSVGRALSLKERGLEKLLKLVEEVILRSYDLSYQEIFRISSELSSGDLDGSIISLRLAKFWIRDMIALSLGAGEAEMFYRARTERLRAGLSMIGVGEMVATLEALSFIEDSLIRNVNRQLAMDVALTMLKAREK